MKREVAAERQVIFVEYVRFNRATAILTQSRRCGLSVHYPEVVRQMLMPTSSVFKWAQKKHTARCQGASLQENAMSASYPRTRGKRKYYKEAKTVAVKERIRVRLKSYDHTIIDAAAEKIVEVAKRNGAEVSGPIPLPTEREIVTILRAVHKYKDSREQFEMRTHKRLIDIMKPTQKVVDALMSIELPAGVEIEVKI